MRVLIASALFTACATLIGCVTQEQVDAGNKFAFHMSAAGSGLIGTGTYLGAAMLGEDGKQFRVHGNWCGAGFPSNDDLKTKVRFAADRSGNSVAMVKPDLAPIDDVDLACARHDLCYISVDGIKQKANRGDCDVILMCELFALSDSKHELAKPRASVLAWAGGANWRYLSSDCNALGYARIAKTKFIVEG